MPFSMTQTGDLTHSTNWMPLIRQHPAQQVIIYHQGNYASMLEQSSLKLNKRKQLKMVTSQSAILSQFSTLMLRCIL